MKGRSFGICQCENLMFAASITKLNSLQNKSKMKQSLYTSHLLHRF